MKNKWTMLNTEKCWNNKRIDKKHKIYSFAGFPATNQKMVSLEHVAPRPGSY